jgi:hypothetical protein
VLQDDEQLKKEVVVSARGLLTNEIVYYSYLMLSCRQGSDQNELEERKQRD